MPQRYICIHGHFYQPVRENPWTGEIPLTPAAYPFHDWNAKIAAECYAPNAWSQIRDVENKVVGVVNNYESLSFNFGPTLLSWLRDNRQEVYKAVIAADRASRERFGGFGSAMAQCYNHVIMPLADQRDKSTQVHWGSRDFEHHFGRVPTGMWLPETAVDFASLEVLAAHGITHTILAPRQIAATRRIGTDSWTPTPNESVESHHPYEVRLPSGQLITVFAYNGPLARAVAFEKLLDDGGRFAERLIALLSPSESEPQLAHIATDGETFGHHHRFGDMGLAFAFHRLEREHDIQLTNYAAFLDRHPPLHEAQIVENSSWSCEHGIERWRSNCGCQSGAHLDWEQKWRGPLREALNALRSQITPLYESKMDALVHDPWAARDDYIDVLLDSGKDSVGEFFTRHQRRRLTPAKRTQCLQLLAMQRHLMLMYSSCGWFFDDISGVEATMLLQHAGRSIDYAREFLGIDPETEFLKTLRSARSNDSVATDGCMVYQMACAPYRAATANTA